MLHSGLAVYAHRSLNILPACDEHPKCLKHNIHTTTPLVFGKRQRTFVIMPYSTAIQQTLMKVSSFGEALLEVNQPKCLKERSVAANSSRKRFKSSPGIPNARRYRSKRVIRGFRDFQLQQPCVPLGISYSKTYNASVGIMTLNDHSIARTIVCNAL